MEGWLDGSKVVPRLKSVIIPVKQQKKKQIIECTTLKEISALPASQRSFADSRYGGEFLSVCAAAFANSSNLFRQ
jgi:hypothetical protein